MNKILLLAFFILTPLARGESIHILGLDRSGKAISQVVTEKEYSELLQGLVAKVQASTLPALSERTEKSSWHLRDIVVGLGISLELGISQVWSVTVEPALQLCFSNSTHPEIPD